ncbi:carboxymuconolactone decarboxylase family protein [Saccharibacillus endophyticus]|uniref:Alkyl hydroperoxide reductase AhpD n=1 Tax=Saccharibacillus endophyticus TaxID=2060666 RepID=A0ABQ1ZTH6_9BACL|nr:carboxymuconolactone decarboxylase family protein [Saccharibacillus endophyticus]GGH75333.1 alkyl hydroperoxide reductase AhpD [Saccharibacillus endophyticus]
MEQRMNMQQVLPDVYKKMMELEMAIGAAGIDKTILELVKIRASQMNGCAFCLNMHTQDARKLGETEQRIYVLPAWREAPFFNDGERAALALAEAVTRLDGHGVPDDVYDEATRQFGREGTAKLIMALVAINGWNRIAVSTRLMPV